MKQQILKIIATIVAVIVASVFGQSSGFAFEGRINAVITQGGETTPLVYTVGTNQLRIEVNATNWPNPVNLVELSSGALTLVFPNNRSFVRLKPAAENASAQPPGMPRISMPAGIGPQSDPAGTAPAVPPPPGGLPLEHFLFR